MKAVTFDALIEESTRQCEATHKISLGSMKRRIERGRLHEVRAHMLDGANQPQALRLMKRRKRNECLDGRERVFSNCDGPSEPVAAMHHAMSHGNEIGQRKMGRKPVQRFVQHVVQVVGDKRFQRDVADITVIAELQQQRLVAKFDHTLADTFCTVDLCGEQSDLDGRRPGVEGQQKESAHDASVTARPERCATILASATDASLTRKLSARLVRMTGRRAPSTRPAASAPPKYINCFASILPASRSGTSRSSAFDALTMSAPNVGKRAGIRRHRPACGSDMR